MAIFTERDDVGILDGASDPEGDALSVVAINGSATLIGAPIALSVGGSVMVAADGSVVLDDTGLSWPAQGASLLDGIIATVSDGTNDVSVAVNIRINHL